ncbi:MAG: hypothetical protein WDM92_04710 [Caulobacteraceae bacterium]
MVPPDSTGEPYAAARAYVVAGQPGPAWFVCDGVDAPRGHRRQPAGRGRADQPPDPRQGAIRRRP